MPTSIQSQQSRARVSPPDGGFGRHENLLTTDLLDRILEAFREGRAAVWTPPPTGPTAERVETEEKRKFQLGCLTASDRTTLMSLSDPREQALALSRVKKLDEADGVMQLARFLLSLAQLSKEGRAYAETMHQAAESYLFYQRGDYTKAYSRMVASLEATDRLAESWGNSEFIVCRRVDLDHNLMRVEMRRGATHEAMQRGARLLRSVSDATLEGTRIDSRVALILFDLIMGTIAELVAPLPAREARSLLSSLSWLRTLGTAPSPRALEWFAIKLAALGNHPERFVKAALPFVRAGRGKTPSLWYAVVLDLTRAYSALDSVAGPAALEEIFTELSTAPRVPSCMRVSGSRERATSGGHHA